jgi:hypothetical protein
MAAYTVVVREERPDVPSATISPGADDNDYKNCTEISVIKAGSVRLRANAGSPAEALGTVVLLQPVFAKASTGNLRGSKDGLPTEAALAA